MRGTGTGRMLELIAPHAGRAIGMDVSPEMLAIARDRLLRTTSRMPRCGWAILYRLPFAKRRGRQSAGFDVVLFHQVLHYLDDPGARRWWKRARDGEGRQAADRRFRTRIRRNSCATNTPIAAWAFPTRKWKAGSPPPA